VVTWRGVIGRVNARGTQAPVWVDGNGKATRLPQAARGRCDPPAPAGQRAGKIRIFLAERGRRGSGNRWKLKRDDGGDNRRHDLRIRRNQRGEGVETKPPPQPNAWGRETTPPNGSSIKNNQLKGKEGRKVREFYSCCGIKKRTNRGKESRMEESAPQPAERRRTRTGRRNRSILAPSPAQQLRAINRREGRV